MTCEYCGRRATRQEQEFCRGCGAPVAAELSVEVRQRSDYLYWSNEALAALIAQPSPTIRMLDGGPAFHLDVDERLIHLPDGGYAAVREEKPLAPLPAFVRAMQSAFRGLVDLLIRPWN